MKNAANLALRYLMNLGMTIFPLFLGWGLFDLRGFLRDPARAAYVVLGVIGSLMMFVPRLNVSFFSKGSKVVGQRLIRAYMISGTLLIVVLPFTDRRGLLTFPESEWLRWVGFVLTTTGVAIRVVGLWQLGRQFSGYVTLQENHQLVQAGLYARIRHPMYLGIVIMMAGVPLVFRSWLVFPELVWNIVFVLMRIGQEEGLLAEHFGSEFESYRQRTWRLVPGVY